MTTVNTFTPRAAEARPLPWCSYPTAADVARHGVQPLPDRLPLADFERVAPHRSRLHATHVIGDLPTERTLEMARVVAESFAHREPQCRYLRPASEPPAELASARHEDAFGAEAFGAWTTERLLYWFIRLLILTDPTSPRGAIRTKEDALAQSLVLVDEHGAVVGGAINETLAPHGADAELRSGDPFLDATLGFAAPIVELLSAQDAEGVAALSRDRAFRDAYERGLVGHHFMIARSDALAKNDTFELLAATAERYRELGFRFFLIEATNQWTGAACEALNGVRVHFAPFRARTVVPASPVPLPGQTSSVDGYLSGKDSGSMLYVIRVA
ncbi:MAG TPA: hypothetical protein VIS07_11765 [Candidatus Binatia bacterium]